MTCEVCGFPSRDPNRCDRCQRWAESDGEEDADDQAEYEREHLDDAA